MLRDLRAGTRRREHDSHQPPIEGFREMLLSQLATKPGGDKARGLLVELALMDEINDTPTHAEQLADFLSPSPIAAATSPT